MTPLTHDDLLEHVRSLFRPDTHTPAPANRIGAELELIPALKAGGERVIALAGHPPADTIVRSVADRFGWTEEPMGNDPSCWSFPDGRITFEPGGQIELSSAPFLSANDLLCSMQKWIDILSSRADALGVILKAIGIEDVVPLAAVPLQLSRERYTRMTRYFDSIGPFGAIMMRQTASLQINVDRGPEPAKRWRLLNALAPYLTAAFANSFRYAGIATGHKSYRAYVWRMLDPRRTGARCASGDPADCYLDFALEAPMIMGPEDDRFPTFRDFMYEGHADMRTWETHLGTLFPEIRPREYFEIRSIDAIAPHFLSAPIAFVTGLVYDSRAESEALEILGDPAPGLIALAGERGMSEPVLADRVSHLARVALKGCHSLGEAYMSRDRIAEAEQFFQVYTFSGRSPADD